MKRFQGVSDDVVQNLRRDVVQGEACGEKQSRFVFEVATDEVSRVVVTLKVSETQRKKKYRYEVGKDSWFSDAESDGNGRPMRGNKSASQSQTKWLKAFLDKDRKQSELDVRLERLMAEWSHSSSW